MINKDVLQEAIESLRNGKAISVQFNNQSLLLFDVKNEDLASNLLQSNSNSCFVLLGSDRMVNQCFKDIPEIAWDMMDYATTPLTLILDDGKFMPKFILNTDGSLAIQKVTEGALFQIVSKFNKPIACIRLNKEDKISADGNIELKQKFEEKIMKIRLNGEIEIIAN